MVRLVVVAIVACVAGLRCAPAGPKLVFSYAEIRGRLSNNGLRFIVMADPTTQLAEVDVRYEVGAREDPPGKAGLAHLVEHLMFQQQPGGPGKRTRMQELADLTLNMNAYTNWDTTHYMLNARAELLDALLKIEAARMHDGCRSISEQEFLREREVVRNELRSRGRLAEALIPRLTQSAIYPPGHAYARPVGGDDDQLSAITLRDACEFMRRYYVPERAVVVIAGGFPADGAIHSIETWFSPLKKHTPAPRRVVEPLVVTGQRKTVEVDLERPWVTVAWPLPSAWTAAGRAAHFGIQGAFFEAMGRTDLRDCATQSAPLNLGGVEAPIFGVALELSSLSRLDECLDHVWKAARDVGYSWDSALRARIDDHKNRTKAALMAGLEPLFGSGSRTDQIADMAQFSRDVDFYSRDYYVFRALDAIGKLDVWDVVAATRRALDRDRATVTVFAPSKQGITTDRRSDVTFHATEDDHHEADVDPSEAHRPLQVPGELQVLSRATRFQLDNGMRVVLLPTEAMPVVAVELMFDAGDAMAPDLPGLATSAVELLRFPPGLGGFGPTGMAWRSGATDDHTFCAVHGVSLYLNVMISGLERWFRTGVYNDDLVEEWQRVTGARYLHKRPHQRLEFAHQQLAAIYGPDHPYTRAGTLVPGLIDKIGVKALRSFREEHYTAANATLVIVGMFDPRRVESQVREAFGYWSRGHKDAPVPRVTYQRTAPAHIGVIGDDDPLVDVALLYPSAPGVAGEQAARLVLTTMLDAQMGLVRDKLGATYGADARRDARIGASAYRLGGAVDAPRAGEALRAMRAGIDALRSGSNFDEMFVRARRKVVQQLVDGSTSSRELVERLAYIARFGVEPSYFSDLLRDVAALSPDQVKPLLAGELDPRSEVIVLLGDRASVTRAFAEAGIDDARLVVPSAK